jgi:hypothetical protein
LNRFPSRREDLFRTPSGAIGKGAPNSRGPLVCNEIGTSLIRILSINVADVAKLIKEAA